MCRLSVNVNKVATLRNARGGDRPNLVQVSQDCETFGAQGITVHPRPDERHIRKQDVYDLKPLVTTEYNIEGYPSRSFLDLIKDIRPEQVTLVPDPPDTLTSDAGWDTIQNEQFLIDTIQELHDYGTRVSLFMEPIAQFIEGAKKTGADRIEFYTGPYAENYPHGPEKAIEKFVPAAKYASEIGLGINAGHDLNLDNLAYFKKRIPDLLEVSIGHAIWCDAIYLGLENTIQQYLRCLE